MMLDKYLEMKVTQITKMRKIVIRGKRSVKTFTKFHPSETTFYLTLSDYEGGKNEVGYVSNKNTLQSVCLHKEKEIIFTEF